MTTMEMTDSVTTTEQDVEMSVETLYAKIDELNQLTKWFNKQGKTLVRKYTKTPRRRTTNAGGEKAKSGFSVPVKVADTLASFLGLQPDEQIPRTEVTKKLTAYIKDKNLQCQDNKKHFICDEALARVFQQPTGTQTNWFEMQKFLSKLLITVKKETAAEPAAPPAAPPAAATKATKAEANAPVEDEPPKKKIKRST